MKMIDSNGNRLMIGNSGIHLKLAGQTGTKQILTFKNGGVVKFVSRKNIFEPKGGKPMVGFNYSSLKLLQEKAKRMKFIHVRIYGKYKKVSVKDLLEKGIFLHFLKSGFEKQIFYNVEDMINEPSKKEGK